MMLAFDEASHTYTADGVVVPSVTQVLAPLNGYGHIPPGVLETARQRGVAVHRMVELDCKGDLDEEGLPEWMLPALVNWRKFVAESGFEMLQSEYRVFNKSYGYAGTLDLFGTMRDGKSAWRTEAFIDIKRSFLAGPLIGVQLAGYKDAYLAQEGIGRNAKRFALKLTETGPYRLEPFTDKSDFHTFISLLNIHQFKRKHSL